MSNDSVWGIVLASMLTVFGFLVGAFTENIRLAKEATTAPVEPPQVIQALHAPSNIPASNRYPVLPQRVVDGDTIEGLIDLGWGMSFEAKIRAADYDAWESRKIRRTVEVTDEEVAKGKAATKALEEFLASGPIYISRAEEDRDVYGRVLGILSVGDKLVFDWMKENGHVRSAKETGR